MDELLEKYDKSRQMVDECNHALEILDDVLSKLNTLSMNEAVRNARHQMRTVEGESTMEILKRSADALREVRRGVFYYTSDAGLEHYEIGREISNRLEREESVKLTPVQTAKRGRPKKS